VTILGIDTSSREGGAVCIARGAESLAIVQHDPADGYAEALFDLFDRALAQAGLDLSQVDGLAVVAGPGSYTGLRIGVMTAKSLAYARGLRLWWASGLEVLARAEPSGTATAVASSAGRSAYYVAAYDATETILAPCRVALDDLMALAVNLPDETRWVVTPDLATGLENRWPDLRLHLAAPLAQSIATAVSTGASWCHRVEPAELVPIYLGPSQAERVHGVDVSDDVHRPQPPRRGGDHG